MDRVSTERFRELMDQIIEEIPTELLRDLNGGILLDEEIKMHPEDRGGDLYVMGEYRVEAYMGRSISLFYGSFMQAYGHLSENDLYLHIKKTVLHELRHHVESLAGERDLEVEDAEQIARYHNRRGNTE